MRFSVRPFRKLQWQLSLSYTLVAVGALLVVELMLFGGLLILLNSDTLPSLMVNSLREQFSVNLRPYLDSPTPDLEGMGRYLSAYADRSLNSDQSSSANTQLWSVQQADQNMAVIDPGGRVLWVQVPGPGRVKGEPLETGSFPGLEKILPAALANETDPEQLFTRAGDQLVMAIPIESQDRQRVLGVMVFLLKMPSITNPNFMGQLLPTIAISLLAFTLFSGLVGSVFGFFTARRLTNRLGRVSAAADAWSRADFSNFISDAADDELGELSRRLNAMAEQLQNLMHTRQDLAALEERNRIARDLHDSVKQQVFATAMQLGAARALLPEEDTPAAQHLAEAERLTRQAQGELTALIQQLRPVALEGKGLARALRELAADWSRQCGIPASFESNGAEGAPAMLQEQALYRIAQEALANVARHSQARSVHITYSRSAAQAVLLVEDDGKGFNPQAPGGGVGLQSMRERVAALGGALEVTSAPGQGTRLSVRLPLTRIGETHERNH